MSNEILIDRVIITGGTGSFGQAMTRFLLVHTNATVVIFSRGEFLRVQMTAAFADYKARLRFFTGDIRDLPRLTEAMEDVDLVLHAAALKHVPVGEYDPDEMVKTNILGTMNVAQAARACKVKRVVMLSTDKSVHAINAYGSSKSMAERQIIRANGYAPNGTEYCCIRYGNVQGSRGSVIPLWRQCLAEGKPLPVTELSMTRFYISLDEAVQFAWFAARFAPRGSILVPHLPAYSMADLIQALCEESGVETAAMEHIGVREGEKFHEQLIADDEAGRVIEYRTGTDIPDAYCIPASAPSWPMKPPCQWNLPKVYDHKNASFTLMQAPGTWQAQPLSEPYNSGTWPYRLTAAQLQQRLSEA